MSDTEKPTVPEMRERFIAYMMDPENKPERLVSKKKSDEVWQTLAPGIRISKAMHGAILKEIGRVMIRAVERCYDNNRTTLRETDV